MLIDFGLATHCSDGDQLWDEEGTVNPNPITVRTVNPNPITVRTVNPNPTPRYPAVHATGDGGEEGLWQGDGQLGLWCALSPFQPHFNPTSTPFQPHFNPISTQLNPVSTPFQPRFNPSSTPFKPI